MVHLVYLRELVIILLLGVVTVAALSRLRVPSIAGFILVGMLVGPGGFGLISDREHVEVLAEVGVALLLFGIGLELSLERLKRLWRAVLIGGALQVSLTIVVVTLAAQALGFGLGQAAFFGFLIAVSSTAIVLESLEKRAEVNAPHGKLTLGILVFQDLLVIPMVMLIPLLSGGSASVSDMLLAVVRAGAVVTGVLLAARLVVPWALHQVARTRQRQLFVLATLLVCIGTAWIVSEAGVSLALGAFLGGLVVAGSEYRHQVMAELIPFREAFTSVFFVSIGMLLAVASVFDNLASILLLLAAVLVGKFLIVGAVATTMRLPLGPSVLAAVALTQIGEFSFVMAREGEATGMLGGNLHTIIIAVAVVSMLITPFLLSLGPRLAASAAKVRPLTRIFQAASDNGPAVPLPRLHKHVIIGGYGYAGRLLAGALEECGVPYVVVELNAETVRQANAEGKTAYFGDISAAEILERLQCRQARALVLVISDTKANEMAVRAAKRLAPQLKIIVRTNYLADLEPLRQAGADEVVSAEQEGGIGVALRIMERCAVPQKKIDSWHQTLKHHLNTDQAGSTHGG